MFGCAENYEQKKLLVSLEKEVYSGKQIAISYTQNLDFDRVYGKLKSGNQTIENYGTQAYGDYFFINRFLNSDIDYGKSYYIELLFESESIQKLLTIPLNIQPSVIINSFCVTDRCSSLTGNIVQNTYSKIKISTYKITAKKITYDFITPYESFTVVHEFVNPVDEDWVENVVFNNVPLEYSSYIATVLITVEDFEGNFAETSLPFRVVRPLEVKHFGKYELAEVYEPVPVTGCIPGSVGNTVQYTESTSETTSSSTSSTTSDTTSRSCSKAIGSTESLHPTNTNETVSTAINIFIKTPFI